MGLAERYVGLNKLQKKNHWKPGSKMRELHMKKGWRMYLVLWRERGNGQQRRWVGKAARTPWKRWWWKDCMQGIWRGIRNHWCAQPAWHLEEKSVYLSLVHVCLAKDWDLQSYPMWISQWHNWFTFTKGIYNYAWNLAVSFPEKLFYLII